MAAMSSREVGQFISERVKPEREDIARAKAWVMRQEGGNPMGHGPAWLKEHGLEEPKEIRADSPDVEVEMARAVRAYSLLQAYYVAVFELACASELVVVDPSSRWTPPLEYRTQHERSGVQFHNFTLLRPGKYERLKTASPSPDADIFLEGVKVSSLHPGIVEAVKQALVCFHRGLYLPAIAILGAAAEATWTECGLAVTSKLSHSQDYLNDPRSGFAAKVSKTRELLEGSKGKLLLKADGMPQIFSVRDAEIWTTALRDRRNALHWGKGHSFAADHSETAALLMGSPIHMRTLEAIRVGCK